MAIKYSYKSSPGGCGQSACLSKDGCPSGVNPDFIIRRHDTKPPFKISVENCEGAMDLRGLVVEVNMWALAKLKGSLDETSDYFRLADDIGFDQVMVGDIIVMDRVRMPERMLVTAFDENNKLIKVQRGYHGTTPSVWKKGSKMRIFRILNGVAESELIFEDKTDVDGTVNKDIISESYLVYEWEPEDTCLPGCYWLEFKLIKMVDVVFYLPGGNWTGEKHIYDGFFYTGSSQTESSVRLSYDQVQNLYLMPDTIWAGEVHDYSDMTFTGDVHNDGSVLLNQTGVSSENDVSYNEEGVSFSSGISLIPSFTDESLTPYYFGCILGEGVEWIRRFPISGEGFLIKIENSFTPDV